ncbi:hypothetical protein GT354_07450, partial [Streptomyces sp. SID3343]|nr:hypothetical protein [Streptomyces sp. SID3343]
MKPKKTTKTVSGAAATALLIGLAAAATATPAQAVGTSTVDGPITRSEIMARAQSWVDEGVPYSQSKWWSDSNGSYRQDCSGFVSMSWHLGSSRVTWTLDDVAIKLGSLDDLQPGDMIDNISTHVVLFAGWTNSSHTTANIYEEAHSGTDARKATYSRSYINANGFMPYRYKNVVDSTPPPAERVMSWYLADSAGASEATRPMFKYGNTPMVPLSGDFDGSGSDKEAAYDPRTSTFYMGDTSILFGNPGDRPVVGRWDGGADLVGVYRPEDSTFYLRHADGSVTSFKYGNGGNWVPVAGDWDGNGT